MTLNIMVMFIFVQRELLTDFGTDFRNFNLCPSMPINAHATFAKNWERFVSCACPPPNLLIKIIFKFRDGETDDHTLMNT